MASAYMFSDYWPGDGVGPEVPADGRPGGYPWWFDGSAVGMFWLPLRWKLILGMFEGWLRALPHWVWALVYLIKAFRSGAFAQALDAVRDVAHDPSTRGPKYWANIDRLAVSNQRDGENTYRSLMARVRFKDRSPEAALLLELAYLSYKRTRR